MPKTSDLLSDNGLVALGREDQTSDSDVPQDITIDRCYIHAFDTSSAKREIALNSKNSTVTCCHISNFHRVSNESQAITAWNGPGPYTITNNYLEAAGQSILFGGDVPSLTNVTPRGITIRDNSLVKPSKWNSLWYPYNDRSKWNAKNLLEFKNAESVVVDHNVLLNSWAPDQDGVGILFNLAAYGGWEKIDQVLLTNNVIENTVSGVFIGKAIDANLKPTNRVPSNITIRNNLFKNLDWRYGGGQSRQEPYTFQVSAGYNVMIDHNTAVTDPKEAYVMSFGVKMSEATTGMLSWDPSLVPAVLTNNIFKWGANDTNPPMYPKGTVYGGNVMVGRPPDDDRNFGPPNWNGMNFGPPNWDGPNGVGFMDYMNGNYRLAPGSRYKGKATDSSPSTPRDPGANIDLLPLIPNAVP